MDLYSDGQLIVNPQDYVQSGNDTDIPTLERRSSKSLNSKMSENVESLKKVRKMIKN